MNQQDQDQALDPGRGISTLQSCLCWQLYWHLGLMQSHWTTESVRVVYIGDWVICKGSESIKLHLHHMKLRRIEFRYLSLDRTYSLLSNVWGIQNCLLNVYASLLHRSEYTKKHSEYFICWCSQKKVIVVLSMADIAEDKISQFQGW